MQADLDVLGPLLSRSATNLTNTSNSEIKAFVSLQLIGLLGCTVLFVTGFFAASALRNPAWFSFVFSWVISTISYLLLFLAGRLRNAPFGLCLVQGALVYSAPPLTAATTLAFLAQVFFDIQNLFAANPRGQRLIWAMLIGPYVLHAIITIETIMIGLQNNSTVRQSTSGIRCYLKNPVPPQTSSFAALFLIAPTIILGGWMCIMLRRHRTSPKLQKYSPSIAIRLVTFSALSITANIVTAAYALSKERSREPNIFVALVPIVTVLIFATEKDVLSVWRFWKWNKSDRKFQEIDV